MNKEQIETKSFDDPMLRDMLEALNETEDETALDLDDEKDDEALLLQMAEIFGWEDPEKVSNETKSFDDPMLKAMLEALNETEDETVLDLDDEKDDEALLLEMEDFKPSKSDIDSFLEALKEPENEFQKTKRK